MANELLAARKLIDAYDARTTAGFRRVPEWSPPTEVREADREWKAIRRMTDDQLREGLQKAVEESRQKAAWAVGIPIVITLEAMGYALFRRGWWRCWRRS